MKLFYLLFICLLFISCDKDLSVPVGKGNYIAVSSSEISSITTNSAKCSFIVNDLNNETVVEQGLCWEITPKPTTANKKISVTLGTGTFPTNLTNLITNQTYYIRPYVKLSSGVTMYGDEKRFITVAATAPKIVQTLLLSKTYSSASFSISVTEEGATISAKGVCYGTSSGPTISNSKTLNGSGSNGFNADVTNLNSNVRYYFRSYATNDLGTSYGIEQSFILNLNVSGPTSKDGSGNIYNSVQIGDQTWTSMNLITTNYQNGQSIPNITDSKSWTNSTIGAYCDFNNDINIGKVYGHLYNYYSVSDSRNICPSGWHVPTKIEYETLINYLGGPVPAGNKLKEVGSLYWMSANASGDNSSGFSARAGAWRAQDALFYYGVKVGGATFWTSTKDDPKYPWVMGIQTFGEPVKIVKDAYFESAAGTSIRCLKD
jgi:uncharacterized protein (TIGR02145 family)